MPLCYSNFKSFRNKSSRIFWFEQLLFSKVDKLTCKGQVGLGLAGKGRWRANTGWSQLSDVIGSSHATSIKIWGCPCKLCQPYAVVVSGIKNTAFSQIVQYCPNKRVEEANSVACVPRIQFSRKPWPIWRLQFFCQRSRQAVWAVKKHPKCVCE